MYAALRVEVNTFGRKATYGAQQVDISEGMTRIELDAGEHEDQPIGTVTLRHHDDVSITITADF